jgi:hypothetical protein
MTLPPPPGNSPQPPQYGGGGGDPFGPPQGGQGGSYPGPPPGGQGGTYSGPPQQSGPPQHHAPSWQPPQQQPPQGPSQPHWAAGPAGPPPKKGGNGMKWALGGVTLIAVIAVTAAVSIALTKGNGGGGNATPTASAAPTASGTASNSGGEIASANDTGPVNIIKEDPTCAAWAPINANFVDTQRKTGWVNRDPSIPAANWTPEVRSQYEEVGNVMRTTADQTVPIVKLTPHRVVRELLQQFIVYARAYSDALPHYVADDDNLSGVALASATTIADICSAINQGSAQSRGASMNDPDAPTQIAEVGDPANPVSFMKTADSTCGEWDRLLNHFAADATVNAWAQVSPKIPASGLKPEEIALNESVAPVMSKLADDVEHLGRSSSNPVIQDFSMLSAQYRRAFVSALPSYVPADSWLDGTAGRSTNIVLRACKAAGG